MSGEEFRDARLLAYALGEADEREVAEVEAWLAEDEAARAALDELREVAALTGDALAARPATGLDSRRRGDLERALIDSRPILNERLVAAAVFVMLCGIVGKVAVDSIGPRHSQVRYETAMAMSVRTPPSAARGWSAFQVPGGGHGGYATGGKNNWRPGGGGGGVFGPNPADLPFPTVASTARWLSTTSTALEGIPGPLDGDGNPLVANVIYEVQGPLNGARINDQYYVSARPLLLDVWPPIPENAFELARVDRLSTFGADVDTASYSFVRRSLQGGGRPSPHAVRIEELVNAFDYADPEPRGEHPFSVRTELADCPWAPAHRLVRIGLRGREVHVADRPPMNLVFLIDVSGSMGRDDKLPLVQRSLEMLVDNLDDRDTVALVVYAGAAGVVLEPTSGADGTAILEAIQRLKSGGSTNGGAGIERAYELASEHFVEGGVNRVLLATDGDFNVGVTGQVALTNLIREKAASGVFLTVLGFGTASYRDTTLEQITNHGNGHYAYIDSVDEARRVLVSDVWGTLVTIAKDVKIQVEFNPAEVRAWRLVGYENRIMPHADFRDDAKDGGEIGGGHSITALYEVVPWWVDFDETGLATEGVEAPEERSTPAVPGELVTVRLRYKQPDGDVSTEFDTVLVDEGASSVFGSDDVRFAAAVAAFGMRLRRSTQARELSWDAIRELAAGALGADADGRRAAFLELVDRAAELDGEGR